MSGRAVKRAVRPRQAIVGDGKLCRILCGAALAGGCNLLQSGDPLIPMNRRTFLRRTAAALGTSALPARAQVQAKQKTIVLQSAWATHNIGDIGHTPGTLRVIE